MRVLITGGAGFLGRTLATCCWKKAAKSSAWITSSRVGLKTSPICSVHPRFQFIQYDVTNYIHVDGPLDLILHLASPASPRDFERLASTSSRSARWARTRPWGWPWPSRPSSCWLPRRKSMATPWCIPSPRSTSATSTPLASAGVYDEAKRFAEAMAMAYHRVPRHGRAHCAHIQYVWRAHAPRRWPRRAQLYHPSLEGRDLTVYGARPANAAASAITAT